MLTFAIALAVAGDLPKDVREAFDKAETFDLYSLEPAGGIQEGKGFHGWPVLGKTTLKGDAAKAVREAVEKGSKDSDGNRAKCFIPRHGIRLEELELVICFECLQAYVYRGGRKVGDFPTTGAPAKDLNKVLTDAGIPLAGSSKK